MGAVISVSRGCGIGRVANADDGKGLLWTRIVEGAVVSTDSCLVSTDSCLGGAVGSCFFVSSNPRRRGMGTAVYFAACDDCGVDDLGTCIRVDADLWDTDVPTLRIGLPLLLV